MKRYLSLPLCCGLLVCFSFLATPVKVHADMSLPAMTQREYIKWMTQLTGDDGLFNANSTDEDYVKWAKKQKMDPKESQKHWNLNAALTKEVLAESLAQFFNLGKPKKGMDYVLLLLREGIALPDQEVLDRKGWMLLVDDFGFSSRTSCIASCKLSPNKPSKKPSKFKPPKPPKPPKVKTPKKPSKKKPSKKDK